MDKISIQDKTLEEVCQEYKLGEEENRQISRTINEIMLEGKTPVQHPVAVIDIAPPGSGKTGLNGMGFNQFPNNNVVIVNSDELKPFHPRINEIAKLYPQYYTKVTNQESNAWTDNLFDSAVTGSYNIIFEGTGRNIKLLQKMIRHMSKYKIVIRAMAVNELNCLMSIIERYEGQIIGKGWGRLVTLDHFYKAYTEILETISQLEKMAEVDLIEVYTRGQEPTKPIRIYSNESKEFLNARLAIINGRQLDFNHAKRYYEETFRKEIHTFSKDLLEEQEILDKIDSLHKVKEEYEL